MSFHRLHLLAVAQRVYNIAARQGAPRASPAGHMQGLSSEPGSAAPRHLSSSAGGLECQMAWWLQSCTALTTLDISTSPAGRPHPLLHAHALLSRVLCCLAPRLDDLPPSPTPLSHPHPAYTAHSSSQHLCIYYAAVSPVTLMPRTHTLTNYAWSGRTN
ncbi:hypothetical protein E2C01_017450 [Portunus trituberculatus]|uniref:Uncharacterized protein n=1 Tax=Portunus trituberculatus TaxID=210409 RepID=A0A5B7DTH3_PORTR|nr:hypothetical protein [Portunus trituberculatus]